MISLGPAASHESGVNLPGLHLKRRIRGIVGWIDLKNWILKVYCACFTKLLVSVPVYSFRHDIYSYCHRKLSWIAWKYKEEIITISCIVFFSCNLLI